MRLYLSSESQSAFTSSRQNDLMAVDSPATRMIGTCGAFGSSLLYSGVPGRCLSSTAILVRSAVAVMRAGVRPRLVAMIVKLFSVLRDGSTVIRIHGLSELMTA
jgi:hypothetical protein